LDEPLNPSSSHCSLGVAFPGMAYQLDEIVAEHKQCATSTLPQWLAVPVGPVSDSTKGSPSPALGACQQGACFIFEVV